jgi:hypothetical protein
LLGSGDLLNSELDEFLQDQLDGSNICVLGNILVLIKSILGKLALLLLDGKLNEEEHHGLQRHDGDISGALVGDVLMQQGQGRGGLADADEFVSPL